jgi:hypothetical protein
MIDKIEFLESQMNNEPSLIIINGLACIHMCIDIAATGNEDLINVINGRK